MNGEVAGLSLGLRGKLSPPPTRIRPLQPLPGNTVALGLGSREGSALPLPVMRGLGKARADRRIAEAAKAVLGTLLLGQREVEQRGWVTFQEPDNWSAKAIVQLVFFYGVEGRGVCVRSIIPGDLG